MATGRLTFLYPHLLRAAARGSIPSWSGAVEAGAVRGVGRRSNSSFAKRHGKAVEPVDWEKQQQQKQQQQEQQPQPQLQESPAKEADAKPQDDQPKPEIGKLYFQSAEKKDAQEIAKDAPETEVPTPKQQEEEAKPQEPINADPNASSPSQSKPADSSDSSASTSGKQAEGRRQPKDELETIFYMGAPENVAQQQQQQQQPTMSLPKYVHHFDSYSLVKQLQEGGYTSDQAITTMKAIRGILAHNLDMAQERLVSKSDVENESYLFSAACSELSAEIKNNRRIQDEHMRQQRTHLQHEIDILTQTLNQELLTLTDNVRGVFNDRKMVVREEQKAVESAIQKINYKMSIMLSSDSKSEIEGVRWILIRRSVLGIIFMAILTLGTLRYATYVSHEKQREADRKKKEEEDLRRDGGKNDRTSAPDAAAILAAS